MGAPQTKADDRMLDLPEGTDLVDQLRRAIGLAENAAHFFTGPFFGAEVKQAISEAVAANGSPWLNRAQAAAYAGRCSESTIDRAARLKIIKAHYREATPLFLKSEIDEAIRSGRWSEAEIAKGKKA